MYWGRNWGSTKCGQYGYAIPDSLHWVTNVEKSLLGKLLFLCIGGCWTLMQPWWRLWEIGRFKVAGPWMCSPRYDLSKDLWVITCLAMTSLSMSQWHLTWSEIYLFRRDAELTDTLALRPLTMRSRFVIHLLQAGAHPARALELMGPFNPCFTAPSQMMDWREQCMWAKASQSQWAVVSSMPLW